MRWEVFGYRRANPHNYDGGKHKHIRIIVPDKPTAIRKAKELMETRDDLVYTTFYPEEE